MHRIPVALSQVILRIFVDPNRCPTAIAGLHRAARLESNRFADISTDESRRSPAGVHKLLGLPSAHGFLDQRTGAESGVFLTGTEQGNGASYEQDNGATGGGPAMPWEVVHATTLLGTQ